MSVVKDSSRKVPAYRLHKPTGRAVVRLSGQDHYLGQHGSPESRAMYHKVVSEWESRGRRAAPKKPSGLTVELLCDAYRAHARPYYVRNGEPTSRVRVIENALKPLCEIYGQELASSIGPVRLETVRNLLVGRGLTRRSCNDYVSEIKGMYQWATAKEMTSSAQLGSLRALAGLRQGRSGAREKGKILPVPQADLERTLEVLDRGGPRGGGPTLAAMCRFQALTGARPGEVRGLRPCDLDKTGEVWVYAVSSLVNKCEHLGQARTIAVGPKAQSLLRPYLAAAAPDAPVFPSARGCHYHSSSYHHAIRNAAIEAGVRPWHPNQLRHSCATAVRARFGLDAARSMLGHSGADQTEVYAERDLDEAKRVALELG